MQCKKVNIFEICKIIREKVYNFVTETRGQRDSPGESNNIFNVKNKEV